MEYFATLTILTLVIVVLALVLYRLTRDVGILVGIAALYYWSLFGAWYILIDKTGGFSGKQYHYLEYKMFAIALDDNYMAVLLLYGAFIIGAELVLLILMRKPLRETQAAPPVTLRHGPILAISFAAAIASWYLISDKVTAAWAMNTSAYYYTRAQTDDWFAVHQVLNRIALLPASIGFAALLGGRRGKYFASVSRSYTFGAYLLLLGGMAAFTFILGNKNEILVALVTGLLAYLGSSRRASLWKAGAVMAAGMWFLYAIDFFRSVPVNGLQEAISGRANEATEVGKFIMSSNEAYAAHFSLYGVLAFDVEPKFGYSAYSLACSVIPRLFWPDRPHDIYLYYSESVGTIQNQGYSIHHATGWYLNFGYLGVPMGGIVLGLIWAKMLRARQQIRPNTRLLFRVFATVAPWLFVAYLPPLVRAGPEGYKGFVIEGVLVPLFTLAFACRPRKQRSRLVWNRVHGWRLAAAR
jgi:hypothetical protein